MRFLPATKALPKEMLPIVDRPLIQIVVDEAEAAGIEHCIFVTGRNTSIIEDHFDKQFELETTLSKRGCLEDLATLEQDLPSAGQTSFTRQQVPVGLGHAIWCARHLVGDEPFCRSSARHGDAGAARMGELVAINSTSWRAVQLGSRCHHIP
jgi:UTP--glucose-1-phosphate uridylyltransferase